jgi:integrase
MLRVSSRQAADETLDSPAYQQQGGFKMTRYKERKLATGAWVWDVFLRIPGFKREQRTFPARSDAEMWATGRETELDEERRRAGLLTSKSFHQEKFLFALDQFMARSDMAESYRPVLKVVKDNFEDLAFGEIRPSTVRAYVAKMMRTNSRLGRLYKGNTMATHLAAMSAVFKWRALEYDIDVKPTMFTRSHLPKGYDQKRIRRLEKDEEGRIMEELRRRGVRGFIWRLMVKLALETGARQQELFLAEWADFDLGRRVWTIPMQNTKCKTERSVPLSKAAVRAMRAFLRLPAIFHDRPFDGLTSLATIRSEWRHITKAAKVEDFRFHDLRHEAISRLVLNKRKLTVFEIMKFVGHSSTVMLSRYANLRGDEMALRID